MEINNEALKELSTLAERHIKAEARMKELTQSLKESTEAFNYISEVLLPNAMQEVGMSSFTLESGAAIEIKRSIHTSVSEERFPAAKHWLVEHGYDGIIKHNVGVTFGKGEDDSAVRAVEALVEAGFAPTDKESIHASTLKATVKKIMESGEDIPFDVFGIHESVSSKVTLK